MFQALLRVGKRSLNKIFGSKLWIEIMAKSVLYEEGKEMPPSKSQSSPSGKEITDMETILCRMEEKHLNVVQ